VRVLVFIVAYEAERHIVSVLERVPKDLWNSREIHFLMIDDGSRDKGVSEASNWLERHEVTNATVLRNPVNQGYGGNQKLGYRIAVDSGFDFVILLHGDGQYAPELLPKFIETWRNTDADILLGSRMTSVSSARKGGMPWYKVAGNRTLTVLQNFLTKRSLSEYHTGYRGYSTRFLRQVPFETNTNVFHFDTEILLQGFHINAKTVEIDIPTHYGDEICRVNGMRYAKDVLIATLKYRMHQMGMLCDLKYRNLSFDRYRDKTQGKYTSHTMALEEVARLAPRTLLDLGCGPGHIAARAKAMGISVTGVDAYEPIEGKMDRFVKVNLESLELPVDPFSFDVVLLLDVIEHLQDPEAFMVMLRNASTVLSDKNRAPHLILSTPNIAFAAIRLNLLLGRFSYAERGILDVTHKRLFTRKSLLTTLRDCGYQIEKVRGVPPPFEAVMPGIFGKLFGTLSAGLAKLWPSMFSFQTLVVCRPMPGVRQLLSASERHLAQGDDAVVATLAALDKA
jgi:2-polyprenyl-3-methyl-5-hydroxy-6-metoxy-1,4-benzoquinol methylase/glycosyltransferase involved in cell wall biosynthesis